MMKLPVVRRSAGLRLAAAILLVGLSCDPKDSEYFIGEDFPGFGTLEGVVMDGAPIPLASVALSGTSRLTTSSAAGLFNFAALIAATYSVVANVTGYTCPAVQAVVMKNEKTTVTVHCTPTTGRITGLVRLDGQPRAGATLTARNGSATATATSGSDGTYSIPALQPGTWTVTITPPAGTNSNCTPSQQTANVQANQTATANFDCTTVPGTVNGTVTVNGVGQPGVPVLITQGGQNIIGQATTGAGGTYTITNVAPGTYVVSITAPSGALCNTPQNVTVQSNQTSTVNFACTSMTTAFSVTFGNPPLSWWHPFPGVSSETCVGFNTSPVQPGSIWTSTWTGPGTVGSNQHSGTLDANGHGIDRQTINQFGTYGVTVNVTSNGVSSSASGSVTVTSAAGSCPP